MTTKLIAILIILLLMYGGWKLFEYWETVKANQEKAAAAENIQPNLLSGLPPQLEASLAAAYNEGAVGLNKWLSRYRTAAQDPRLGWIELDYVVLITKDKPAEAKKIFAEVKGRTKPDSPIHRRVQKLAKTYD